MLDKKVFSAGLNELKAVFPNWNVDLGDPFVLGVWYKSFKHMDNSNYKSMVSRSEERRVGKECRSRWSPYH